MQTSDPAVPCFKGQCARPHTAGGIAGNPSPEGTSLLFPGVVLGCERAMEPLGAAPMGVRVTQEEPGEEEDPVLCVGGGVGKNLRSGWSFKEPRRQATLEELGQDRT